MAEPPPTVEVRAEPCMTPDKPPSQQFGLQNPLYCIAAGRACCMLGGTAGPCSVVYACASTSVELQPAARTDEVAMATALGHAHAGQHTG